MPGANPASPFYQALNRALPQRGVTLEQLCPDGDPVAQRVLHDYGAMFVGAASILPPPVCVFTSERDVSQFQAAAGWAAATIGEATVELQPAAMAALLRARGRANSEGLDITPRDGAEAARRDYADTVRLWNSRFLPALEHWRNKGRLTADQVSRLRTLPINSQVSEVLELEKQRIFFSKD